MISTIQPHTADISTVDALWVLIQSQTKSVRKALAKRILAEEAKTKAQQTMVKESLSRAYKELHAGKIHTDAHKLFDPQTLTEDITKTEHYRQAMEDVRQGRVYHYESLQDFYKEMGL